MIDFIRLDHVLISIPPGSRAQARMFYTQVLALTEIQGQHPHGALWFQLGDAELHVREEEGHTSDSSRHPAFEIRDLAEAKSFLLSRGVDVSYSSEIDGRDRCFFRDPWGNRFELIEYKQAVAKH
ncbi:MAG: phage portal protein [Lunatimonas sp.]|uniref:VOC family protein n=1 Tax=Lunatimonas sp. TaxID=2060141 RepID=UPI00263B4735|nr:VOC family protein [Lunatimonas sp.]MCC5936692.1 phage portal protein [Lunatimonas sp.]